MIIPALQITGLWLGVIAVLYWLIRTSEPENHLVESDCQEKLYGGYIMKFRIIVDTLSGEAGVYAVEKKDRGKLLTHIGDIKGELRSKLLSRVAGLHKDYLEYLRQKSHDLEVDRLRKG